MFPFLRCRKLKLPSDPLWVNQIKTDFLSPIIEVELPLAPFPSTFLITHVLITNFLINPHFILVYIIKKFTELSEFEQKLN